MTERTLSTRSDDHPGKDDGKGRLQKAIIDTPSRPSASELARERFAFRPDAQAFDEISIKTIPRYKESYLSGDEWRIHAETIFFRKGVQVHSVGCRNIETACGRLYAAHGDAIDNGKAYFAGDGIHCDQEGCSERATVKYRKIFDFSDDGTVSEPHTPSFRCFCDRHKNRGDCGLDDTALNYHEVAKLSADAPAPENPSLRVEQSAEQTLLAERDRLRGALTLCVDEMQESLDNEGRLASFRVAIEKARAALHGGGE